MCNFCSLLWGPNKRFNKMLDEGASVVVTYAFARPSDLLYDVSLPANASLRRAMEALERDLERVAGIELLEVAPTAEPMVFVMRGDEDLSFGYPPFTSWTSAPNSANTTSYMSMAVDFRSYAEGTWGYEVLLHEFGHVFGLKHPFQGQPRLPAHLDTTDHTVMSYTWTDRPQDDYQELDVAALRRLYGKADAFDGAVVRYNTNAELLRLNGTVGDDAFVGINTRNKMKGFGGNDTLAGRDADDKLFGQDGHDDLKGMAGHDILFGQRGADRLEGGGGTDRLAGGRGSDTLDGGTGDDLLRGGRGDDALFGGNGRDTMIGGLGDDTLRGGRGADVFRVDSGSDVIVDFSAEEHDRLDLRPYGLTKSEAILALVPMGGNLVFDTGSCSTVILNAADDIFDIGLML